MRYLLAEKWTLNIPDHLVKGVKPEWVAQYTNKDVALMPYNYRLASPNAQRDIAAGIWCYEYMLQILLNLGIHKECGVVEYFAGVGRDSTIIQNMLHPEYHAMVERDSQCCDHLRHAFPQCDVMNEDFFGMSIGNAEVSFLDPNTFTAVKLAKDERWQKQLRNVLENSTFTIITDSAISRLGLHWKWYANAMGIPASTGFSIGGYIDGLSKMMYCMFGHSIRYAVYHPHATYLLIVDGYSASLGITKSSSADYKYYFQEVEVPK